MLFFICTLNMCSSCSNSRKMEDVLAGQRRAAIAADSMNAATAKNIDLQMQLMQPQVVNQFLSLFNAEKYKNEIQLNNAKIEALQQQVKNMKNKNDTAKTHR